MEFGEDTFVNIGSKTASILSFVLGGKLTSLFLSGLLLIFLTRALGPSSYGIYTLAIAVAGIFGSMGNFGISTALNKFVSEYKYKKDAVALRNVISNGITLALVIGIVLSAITFLMAAPIAYYILNDVAITGVLQLAAFTLFTAMFVGAAMGVLVGLGKGGQVLKVNLVQSVVQIVVTLALVAFGFGPSAPILGLILGYLGGGLEGVYLLQKGRIRIALELSIKESRKLLAFSIPVALSNLLVGILPDLSVIALGAYTTAAIVGNFGIAIKINTLLGSILTDAIAFSLLSAFTVAFAGKNTQEKIGSVYNYSIYFAFLFVVPAIAFLAVMAKPISYILFSGVYTLAPLYIAIISLGAIIWIFGLFATDVLVGSGKVIEVLKYNVLVDIIVIGLLPFVLNYQYGLGIIIDIFIVAPLIYDAIFFAKIRQVFKVRLEINKLARIIFVNVVNILLILIFILPFITNFILLIIISLLELLIIYPLLVAAIGAVQRSDLELVENVTKKIPVVRYAAWYFVAYTRMLAK
ncbi:MAG: oligosaccharide flippase family protein [Candidatus Micrarchaeota archaeon]|nr:oligosaccharide flippase family protein [Candidatus Micrarchaeota archaeon]